VKFFSGAAVVSQSDEAWAYDGTAEDWVYLGQFPGAPTTTKSTTWGAVKGEFAEK